MSVLAACTCGDFFVKGTFDPYCPRHSGPPLFSKTEEHEKGILDDLRAIVQADGCDRGWWSKAIALACLSRIDGNWLPVATVPTERCDVYAWCPDCNKVLVAVFKPKIKYGSPFGGDFFVDGKLWSGITLWKLVHIPMKPQQ